MVLERITEKEINKQLTNFIGQEKLLNKYRTIADSIFGNKSETELGILKTLEFSGSIFIYGRPGVGKTSVAYSIAKYVLDEYEVATYFLPISNIFTADLGKTTSNLTNSLNEIIEKGTKNGVLLIMDEIDRFHLKRGVVEEDSALLEVKRALIELLDFLDKRVLADKILIIGITNVGETIDRALTRRFDIEDKMEIDNDVIGELLKTLNNRLDIHLDVRGEEKLFDYFCNSEGIESDGYSFILSKYKGWYLESKSGETSIAEGLREAIGIRGE